jgi:hypothetical protein
MNAKTAAAKLHIEKLVDAINPTPDAREAIVAVATHAYIMGLSHTVVDFHATSEAAAAVARELAAPLGIQFGVLKQANTPAGG